MKIISSLLLLLFISLALTQEYDWTKVKDTVNFYLSNGAFAGGVLRVSNGTSTIYNQPFGYFSHQNLPYSSNPFTNETIFDIASLTKVTATLSCIMHLFDQGKILVDDLVTKYIPEYGNHGKENTTLRNLLLHNAGLLPDYPPPLPKSKQ
jgi:CubicO group peptidase (beta-lactamase class C family)